MTALFVSFKVDTIIIIDENTKISGVPASAWEYKLGN
jgi:hypothetical protein